MSLVLSNDESTRTRNRLDILLNNAVIGFVLVVLALLVFLDWRTALVTSISVPIVILATLAAMDAWGITFNLISMLAVIIALGMFVDNSIVISENIFRLKQEGYSNKEAAYKGVKEIAAPITATVATTIAAFLPMFVTAGIMGRFIWAIPAVVSSSLIISLFDSFFLLPTRILAIGGTVEQTGSHWFGKIRKSFERQLHFLVKHRWVSLGLAVSLLVGSVAYAIFGLNFILFPPEGVDRFIVRYEAKAGVPIERVHEEISKVERAILELPETELRALVTRTGIQQTQPNDPLAQTGDQVGMITVYLTPENDRKRVADEIIAELKEKAPTYGVFKSIQYEKIANGPPVGKPITLSVQGGDIDRLKEIAADITGTLSNIEGVTDINQDLKPGLKQLRVKLKPRAQELHGLTVNDVAQAVRTAHEGRVASVLNRFDEDIDIRVLFPTEARGDRKTLSGLLIEDRRGNLIPLEKVASVIEEPGPVARRHFQFQRSVTVTAEVDTEVITSVEANNQVRQAYSDFENTFSGYSLKFGGEEESTQESLVSLRNAMVIAAVAIFGILVALFSSFSKPLLIMFSIPFGMIGTVVGFALHQKALGFLAMIGIIGLAGVVVNSAIVLISFIELLRYQEGKPLLQAVVEGASMRLRPVLLTSVTTVSALFPTAYGLGGWDPTLVPMTLAMAWGLLFGTALTLIVVPCGYMAIEDILRLVGRDKTPDQAYQTASF
jgi:multidrug efflux pump subunit AcrB